MKRKLLIATLIVLMTIVAVGTLAGCEKTKYDVTIDIPDGGTFYRLAEAKNNSPQGSTEEGSSVTYHFEMQDNMDIDTLKFYVNDVATNFDIDSSYSVPTKITGNFVYIGSYTIENVTEDVKMHFTAKETTIEICFTLPNEPSSLSSEQLAILNDLSVKDSTTLADAYNSPITITTTYNELMLNEWAIPMTYRYTLGCVNIEPGFLGYNIVPKMSVDNLNTYNIYLLTDGTAKTSYDITIDPSKVSYHTFTVEYGTNSLITLEGTSYDPSSGYTLTADPDNNFVIKFDTTTPGIDYTNATLKINDTVVMGLGSGIAFSTSGFQVSCYHAPVFYSVFTDGDIIGEEFFYYVTLEGVTFNDADFIKFKAPDYVQIVSGETPVFYVDNNGVQYYKASDFPTGLQLTAAVEQPNLGYNLSKVQITLPSGDVYNNTFEATYNAATNEQEVVPGELYTKDWIHDGINIKFVVEYRVSGTDHTITSMSIYLPAAGIYTLAFSA